MDPKDQSQKPEDGQGFIELIANNPANDLAEPDFSAIRNKVSQDEPGVDIDRLSAVGGSKKARKLAVPLLAASMALALGTGAGYSLAARGDNNSAHTSNSARGIGCPPSNPNCNSTTELDLAGKFAGGSSLGRDAIFSSQKLGGFGYGQMWFIPSAGLSDESGTAPGYIFSTEGIRPKDLISRLVEAFGIGANKITEDDYSINLQSTDSDANLWLNKSDLSWSFDQQSKSPFACQSVIEPPVVDKAGSEGVAQPSSTCTAIEGKALTDKEAEAVAKKLFNDLGLSPADATWTVSTGDEYFEYGKNLPYVHVTADLLVDGQKSGLSWYVNIAPDKSISAASGYLSKVEKTANYEVVGAKTAALRSHDLRWANFYGAQFVNESNGGNVQPLFGNDVNPSGQSIEIAKDDAGRPLLQLGLNKVDINSASPGLIGIYLDQTYSLLPAYKLCGTSGCWLQVAVADKYLIEK